MRPPYSLSRALLLAVLFIGLMYTAQAQAPAWQAAIASQVSAAGSGATVTATAVDAAGNVYLAGWFNGGTVIFGNMGFSGDEHAPGDEAFVAKWSPVTQGFLWTATTRASWGARATGIAVSGNNVYVTGYFSNGGANFGNTRYTTTKFRSVFVAKLVDAGTSGTWAWVQKVDTDLFSPTPAVAVSGTSVYVASSFAASATVGTTVLTSAGAFDVFVGKLTDTGATGNWVWAQRAGGAGAETAVALAANGSNLYVAGTFEGAASFGSATATSAGGTDAYVARLTDSGSAASFGWVSAAGGSGADYAQALAVSGPNVYLAGSFEATAAFGGISLISAGLGDAYVAKLTDVGNAGSFSWVRQGGGSGEDRVQALALNGATLYAAGKFSGAAGFGSTSLSSFGGTDIFAARVLDAGPTGSLNWVKQAGSQENDAGYAVSAASDGSIYVAGGGGGSTTINFDAISPRPSRGQIQAFLATTTDATATATHISALAAGVTVYPNPAHNRVTIHIPIIPGTATAALTILDALGRAIRTQTAPTNARAALDLTGLVPGLYAVRVTAGAATATQRLVVE